MADATPSVLPFRAPVLDAKAVMALNALLGRRLPAMSLEGLSFSAEFCHAARMPGCSLRLDLRIGDEEACLLLMPETLEAAMSAAGARLGSPPDDTELALAVLEVILDPLLAAAEQALGAPVHLLRLGAADMPSGAETTGGGAVGIEGQLGGDPYAAVLQTPRAGVLTRIAGVVEALSLARAASSVREPPIAVALRAGTARLGHEDFAKLRPGSGIVMERALLAGGRGMLVVGEAWAAPARLVPGGAMPDVSPRAGWEDWIMVDETDSALEATALGSEGALRVTLVFELARRLMTLDEVRAIGPGQVVALPHADPQAVVDILCNGARLGRGEIVQVGGALAVRVTEIARRD